LCRSNGGRNTGEILSGGVQIPSQRTWIVPVVAGALSFIAGLTILFIVWASSDGIGQATWAKVIWPIVSFPLFTLISKDFATLYFWEVAVTNNLLWAGAVASLTWAQAVEKTRMSKAKSVLFAVSVAIISTGHGLGIGALANLLVVATLLSQDTTFSMSAILDEGSPLMTTMSACLPGASEPMRSDSPRNAA
jgi:hypothetical protein